jgi:hypothetical protein
MQQQSNGVLCELRDAVSDERDRKLLMFSCCALLL